MNLNKMDWTSAKTPAYILVVILVSIIVVFLPYSILYDYVETIFYNMAIANGGDVSLWNLITFYWRVVIPFMFVVSLILYSIAASMRKDEDDLY